MTQKTMLVDLTGHWVVREAIHVIPSRLVAKSLSECRLVGAP